MKELPVAVSESRDCCTYPKGCYFDYVGLYEAEDGSPYLLGKGRYGCLTRVDLTQKQLKEWENIYRQNNGK